MSKNPKKPVQVVDQIEEIETVDVVEIGEQKDQAHEGSTSVKNICANRVNIKGFVVGIGETKELTTVQTESADIMLRIENAISNGILVKV